jgi:hypothetical protein
MIRDIKYTTNTGRGCISWRFKVYPAWELEVIDQGQELTADTCIIILIVIASIVGVIEVSLRP